MAGRDMTTREMIDTLIGFDTVSAKSNMALIEWVADYLDGHGIAPHIIHSEDKLKANLFATIGPVEDGGVALSGHTDVVPVEGQPWDNDPFTVIEKDGKLYGRGTCDMKSFLAIALAKVPQMKSSPLKKPLHLALSYDEEIGCLGAPRMIEAIGRNLPKPAIVIVGEPTEMKVANAHKGPYVYETVVTGLEAHSSQTHIAVNAIHYAARVVSFLEDLAEEMTGRAEPGAAEFVPPYSTISVTTVDGGTANNIVPRQCVLGINVRQLPGTDPEEILRRLNEYTGTVLEPKMKAVDPGTGIASRLVHFVPPLRKEEESPAEALAKYLTESNETTVISFGTEGGQFQDGGMSTVVCGPGSIQQAHKPNEFIALSEVAACERFVDRLIGWACKD
ncbi:MAG: acetylornithine deacetylase [Proteobacteria bacterium]|nr:acetylornithine deacetylase [Pseudomonadota bacterium]